MNTAIAPSCQCYGVYENGNQVGFMGVLHQPHGRNPKIKRVSRLVVLPDYQGIGLGYKFLNVIAEHYTKQGFDFSIVTSAKNLACKLASSEKWTCINVGLHSFSRNKSAIDYKRKSLRSRTKTASFYYKKE